MDLEMSDALDKSRLDKLQGVHPRLVEAVKRICYAMHELGFALVVTDGVRTLKRQQELYAQGRTTKGPIVTYADGVRSKSNHQLKADGFGYAVDLVFLDKDGKPSWSELHPWDLLGAMARSQHVMWGGDFVRIKDRPHLELPEGLVH
jgi:peptidoglycan L-alanyl-D-glutamate endopeptidase CwlK